MGCRIKEQEQIIAKLLNEKLQLSEQQKMAKKETDQLIVEIHRRDTEIIRLDAENKQLDAENHELIRQKELLFLQIADLESRNASAPQFSQQQQVAAQTPIADKNLSAPVPPIRKLSKTNNNNNTPQNKGSSFLELFSSATSSLLKDVSAQLSSTNKSLSASSSQISERAEMQRNVKTLQGHYESINCIAMNHQFSLMATGSSDRTVKLWDPATCMLHSQLPPSGNSIVKLCFSRSNAVDHLASGSLDHHAHLYSITNGKLIASFKHDAWVYGVDLLDSTRLLSAGHDNLMKLWDILTTKPITTFSINSSCNDLEISPANNSSLFCTVHHDYSVRFWDYKTGQCVKNLEKQHNQSVTSCNFSQDGWLLLTNSRDDTLHVIDTRTYKKILTLQDKAYKNGMIANKARFCPNSTKVCAGSALGSLVIWDFSNVQSVQSHVTERVHMGLVSGVIWRDEQHVISCAKDGNFVIYWSLK